MTQQTVGGIVPEFTIGDRLRKAREITGLGQTEFARQIDQSRQTISNYEVGNSQPRMITLKAWAMRTGVSLEWLLTGKNPQPEPDPDGGEECAIRDSNPEPAD